MLNPIIKDDGLELMIVYLVTRRCAEKLTRTNDIFVSGKAKGEYQLHLGVAGDWLFR
jgi:hypothetical protein